MSKVMVSLDGGVTYQEAINGVRVIYDDLHADGCDEAELHLNCTDEGVITDIVWYEASGATQSEMAQEIVDRMLHECSM